MPVIHTHVSVSTTPGQREALKAAYGKAITAVPGKSEGWLMCPFEDNMPIYFGGDDSKPAAYVEVNVFGRSVPGSDEVSTVPSRFAHIANLSPHLREARLGSSPDYGREIAISAPPTAHKSEKRAFSTGRERKGV